MANYVIYKCGGDRSSAPWCVLSRVAVAARVTPTAIRAKMVVGELQGPLTQTVSCITIPKHHKVNASHIFLVGVYRSCWLVCALAGQTCW